MKIKGTQSEKNLLVALNNESFARNKYTFYGMSARRAGHGEIADAFERMARNEMLHAKFWFDILFSMPEDTAKNLNDVAGGEYEEWHDMYPEFARQAREEGLEDLARMMERVAAIERDHERQFLTLLAELKGGHVETQGGRPVAQQMAQEGYRCIFCGATYRQRPDTCEVCHAIGSFEVGIITA